MNDVSRTIESIAWNLRAGIVTASERTSEPTHGWLCLDWSHVRFFKLLWSDVVVACLWRIVILDAKQLGHGVNVIVDAFLFVKVVNFFPGQTWTKLLPSDHWRRLIHAPFCSLPCFDCCLQLMVTNGHEDLHRRSLCRSSSMGCKCLRSCRKGRAWTMYWADNSLTG